MLAGISREQITMARTLAALPAGSRITDYISLGVIAKFFPAEKVQEVLQQTKRASVRERDLPAHVVVYYVIALALYMRSSYREVLRCLLEGVQWLLDPSVAVKVAGKSGISQARSRLGSEPLRKLYEAIVEPIATKRTKGAWYRQWRLISLDGSTLDTADTVENEKAFGRPGASRGSSAFPKIRFVALVENGPHVSWAARMSQVPHRRDYAGSAGLAGTAPGNAVSGGPLLPRLQTLANGGAHQSGSAVAHPPERAFRHRSASAGRLLSQSHLPFDFRSTKPTQGDRGPRDRLSFEGRQRRGSDLPVDYYHPGPHPRPRPGTGGPLP